MSIYTKSVQKLIDNLSKLPGLGYKSAERLALYIINMKKSDVKNLASSVWEAKKNSNYCKICNNFSESEVCKICNSAKRSKKVICVVEQPKDVIALEKSHSFNGVYHVLMGTISPLDGVSPEDIALGKLMNRLKEDEIEEIIIATNSDTEGETTALYIKKMIAKQNVNVKITRIASGVPVGSQLEYSNQATLSKALKGRQDF